MTNEYLKHRQNLKIAGKVEKIKVPKAIAPRSEKLQTEMDKYKPAMIAFLKANPKCQAGLEGCKKESECVHHKAGRVGKKLHDQKDWLAVCLPCHATIHVRDLEAKAKGLSKSRHKKPAA